MRRGRLLRLSEPRYQQLVRQWAACSFLHETQGHWRLHAQSS
jgi:hypothetical protein